MPTIAFSPNIRSHVEVDSCVVEGATVGEVLESVFSGHSKLRSYLFDDDGSVRKHIALILNGEPVIDRKGLTDRVRKDDEIFIMQALSGG